MVGGDHAILVQFRLLRRAGPLGTPSVPGGFLCLQIENGYHYQY